MAISFYIFLASSLYILWFYSLNDWNTLPDAITSTADKVISYWKCQNQDWSTENSEEIEHLINKKRLVRITFKNHQTRNNMKHLKQEMQMCQRHLREIQNKWWQVKATDLQNYADQKDMHRYYAGTKEIFGHITLSIGALKTFGGQKLTTEEEIMHC